MCSHSKPPPRNMPRHGGYDTVDRSANPPPSPYTGVAHPEMDAPPGFQCFECGRTQEPERIDALGLRSLNYIQSAVLFLFRVNLPREGIESKKLELHSKYFLLVFLSLMLQTVQFSQSISVQSGESHICGQGDVSNSSSWRLFPSEKK